MDEDGLPIVGAAVDLTKVPPIDSKRILAFLNHFICHTMNFLNKFSVVCETKLEDVNVRIQRMETSLSILESKLASIPGLDDISLTTVKSDETETSIPVLNSSIEFSSTPISHADVNDKIEEIKIADAQERVQMEPVSELVEQSPSTITVAQDERYAKYLKLIQVGVPAMALRPKMLAEGLDPDLLNSPNATVPEPKQKSSSPTHSGSSSSNDSASDFSD